MQQAIMKRRPSSDAQFGTARGQAGDLHEGEADQVTGLLRSPGQPLDQATRDFFELRFGREFSRVRVHADGEAADAMRARAFTVGHDIVFGAGEYAPGTAEGKRLLAHELAHVVQQSGQPSTPGTVMRDAKHDAPKFPAAGAQIIGADAPLLLTVLSDCSGFQLGLDKDHILNIKSQGDPKKARSAKARAAVKDFAENKAGVVINADPKAESVTIGAFSHEHPGFQTIDVTNVRKLEAASGEKKGVGVCDAVLHELVESVAGRRLSKEGKLGEEALFKAAHEEGQRTETEIRKELRLPPRSDTRGDTVVIGNIAEDRLLVLTSLLFGSGKDTFTQLNVIEIVLGPVREEEGKPVRAGDNNVVASHVVKGELHFKNQDEAIAVFNRFARDFGYKPIAPERQQQPAGKK
jgi:hypothetical protein